MADEIIGKSCQILIWYGAKFLPDFLERTHELNVVKNIDRCFSSYTKMSFQHSTFEQLAGDSQKFKSTPCVKIWTTVKHAFWTYQYKLRQNFLYITTKH